jgi:hypothetical protein
VSSIQETATILLQKISTQWKKYNMFIQSDHARQFTLDIVADESVSDLWYLQRIGTFEILKKLWYSLDINKIAK